MWNKDDVKLSLYTGTANVYIVELHTYHKPSYRHSKNIWRPNYSGAEKNPNWTQWRQQLSYTIWPMFLPVQQSPREAPLKSGLPIFKGVDHLWHYRTITVVICLILGALWCYILSERAPTRHSRSYLKSQNTPVAVPPGWLYAFSVLPTPRY